MSKNVLQTIRSRTDSFSRGQKRIADYILMNYDKAAFMTAGHLGRKAQVSESTVVRFASQLGYDGYPNMQRALQELVRGKLTSLQRIQVSRDQMQEQDVLTGVMQRDMNSIHTAIETAGFAPYEHLKAVADQCDRVLYDVKSMDDAVHRSYIGVSNRQILDNLCRLADSGAEVIVRVPLIHNVNDSAENITRTAELAAAHGIREIDLLPFHRLGESKYAVIQQPYTMPDATVPQEHIDALAALLRQRGFIVSIGG